MTTNLTPEAIDAMFERMNPEPDTPSDLGNLTMFARERHARWEAKREGFRQAMGIWEQVGSGCNALNVPPGTPIYRLKEPTFERTTR